MRVEWIFHTQSRRSASYSIWLLKLDSIRGSPRFAAPHIYKLEGDGNSGIWGLQSHIFVCLPDFGGNLAICLAENSSNILVQFFSCWFIVSVSNTWNLVKYVPSSFYPLNFPLSGSILDSAGYLRQWSFVLNHQAGLWWKVLCKGDAIYLLWVHVPRRLEESPVYLASQI